MKTVLAIDLAWTGPSGWVQWNEWNSSSPLVCLGEFQPIQKDVSKIADEHYGRWLSVLDLLFYAGTKMPASFDVVYEYSDWSQPVGQQYGREKTVQHALGAAEAVFCLACIHKGVTPHRLGVTEARHDFGAKNKDEVRTLLTLEYQGIFELDKTRGGWLVYVPGSAKISKHVADAIVLAKVFARRQALLERAGK